MQISSINSSNPNKKSNQTFSGYFSDFRPGKFKEIVESNFNLDYAVKKFAEKIELDTSDTFSVCLREMPEREQKLSEGASKNTKIFFDDSKTGVVGSLGFNLDPNESAANNFVNLCNSLKDAARDSFIR